MVYQYIFTIIYHIMSSIWLLITHCSCLFPLGVFMWNYKIRKETESIFIICRFLYTLMFSLMYHSYHVKEEGFIKLHDKYRDIWVFLDGQQSASLIVNTVLYCCRVRDPWIYILSYNIDTLILVMHFFDLYFLSIYFLVLSTFITFVYKYKTILRYIKFFYINSLLCFTFCGSAFFCYFYYQGDGKDNYILLHSLWHILIFGTAGFGGILRYKLNNKLYPVGRRPTLNSI